MPRKEKVLSYTAVFEPLENGGYMVTVPALPGLVTDGVDFEDALEMAKDAIQGHIEALAALGEPIPRADNDKPKRVAVRVNLKKPLKAKAV
jgi:predicted RNase H-like HicB family nuclease